MSVKHTVTDYRIFAALDSVQTEKKQTEAFLISYKQIMPIFCFITIKYLNKGSLFVKKTKMCNMHGKKSNLKLVSKFRTNVKIKNRITGWFHDKLFRFYWPKAYCLLLLYDTYESY